MNSFSIVPLLVGICAEMDDTSFEFIQSCCERKSRSDAAIVRLRFERMLAAVEAVRARESAAENTWVSVVILGLNAQLHW